jgi:starvation-inducible DNA-binding protein
MHKTSIDLKPKTREAIIRILTANLATAIDLGLQAKMAHWNVRGPHFIGLHELFDKVADMAGEHADLIAERIGQLGGAVKANLASIARETELTAMSNTISKEKDVTKALVKALAAFAKTARQAIDDTDDADDEVSSDLMTQVTRETDKMLWFVEAHLQ